MPPRVPDRDWCARWERATAAVAAELAREAPDAERVQALARDRQVLIGELAQGAVAGPLLTLDAWRVWLEAAVAAEAALSETAERRRAQIGQWISSLAGASGVRKRFGDAAVPPRRLLDGNL